MAIGSILNALWDLWAKTENKPLWKLLVDLPPERIVHSIDWRYLRDALTPEEALERLKNARSKRTTQEKHVIHEGEKPILGQYGSVLLTRRYLRPLKTSGPRGWTVSK